MSDAERLRRLAHHEAGHAVVCFVLYGEQVIKGVTLPAARARAAYGATEGEMTTFSRLPIPLACRPPMGAPRRGNPAPVSADAIVDAHGVLSYAGVVAEELHAAAEGDAVDESEWSKRDAERQERARLDRATLCRLAGILGVERPEDEFFEEYWQEARRLLRAHWSAVEALAGELAERGTLNGDRVDALLRAHC